MADYLLFRADGSGPITVPETGLFSIGGINLVGRGIFNYGATIATNQLRQLENFASGTSPSTPQTGQIWFDKSVSQLKVNKGSPTSPIWNGIGGATASPTQPTGLAIGEFWYDTVNKILYVFDGTGFEFIGDETFANDTAPSNPNTGDLWFDTNDVKLNVYDGSTWISVGVGGNIDNDLVMLAGFQILIDQGTVSTPGLGFRGDANTGIFSKQDGNFSITANATEIIDIGSDGMTLRQGQFLVPSGTNVAPGIAFSFDQNAGIRYDEGNINYSFVLNSQDRLTITNGFINANVEMRVPDGTPAGPGLGFVNNPDVGFYSTGDDLVCVINGQERYQANATGGRFSGDWVLESGATLESTYADLAERYHSDEPIPPGYCVTIGGENEIALTNDELDINVFGVISTDPAFKMNRDAGEDDTHPYVALQGRVPVVVKGKISKGDRLVPSNEPGIARALNEDDFDILDSQHLFFTIIGRALEDKDTQDTGMILAVVGVK